MSFQMFRQLLDELHNSYEITIENNPQITKEAIGAILSDELAVLVKYLQTNGEVLDKLHKQFYCLRSIIQDPRFPVYLLEKMREPGQPMYKEFSGPIAAHHKNRTEFIGSINTRFQFEYNLLHTFLLIREGLQDTAEADTPDTAPKPAQHPEEIRDIASRISGIPYTSREFQKLSAYLKENGWKISDKVQICYELNPTMNGVTLANALVCAPETLYKNSTYKRLFSKKQK